MTEETRRVAQDKHAGMRLDKFLGLALPRLSRALVQKWVEAGKVAVNGAARKSSYRLRAGDAVVVQGPDVAELLRREVKPVEMPLDVLYEDDAVIVINKPAGLVVHPTPPRAGGVSLVGGLLHHCAGQLSDLGDPLRRGIVHRLDRDTSGVLIVAKTNKAHERLAEQFRERRVRKKYLAVVHGEVEQESGEISLPIGRDSKVHDKKVVRHIGRDGRPAGRPAISYYQVKERFRGFTVVELQPRTGRTHQLRVHMNAIGHPVVGDRMYGGKNAIFLSEIAGLARTEQEPPLIARQALHALEIAFVHPMSGEPVSFTAPVPADVESVVAALRKLRRLGKADDEGRGPALRGPATRKTKEEG